ncbi:MAG: hypothetical protein V9H25_13215 [Candidatus Competibacter sp.]
MSIVKNYFLEQCLIKDPKKSAEGADFRLSLILLTAPATAACVAVTIPLPTATRVVAVTIPLPTATRVVAITIPLPTATRVVAVTIPPPATIVIAAPTPAASRLAPPPFTPAKPRDFRAARTFPATTPATTPIIAPVIVTAIPATPSTIRILASPIIGKLPSPGRVAIPRAVPITFGPISILSWNAVQNIAKRRSLEHLIHQLDGDFCRTSG